VWTIGPGSVLQRGLELQPPMPAQVVYDALELEREGFAHLAEECLVAFGVDGILFGLQAPPEAKARALLVTPRDDRVLDAPVADNAGAVAVLGGSENSWTRRIGVGSTMCMRGLLCGRDWSVR
jgi:hypothetical protein